MASRAEKVLAAEWLAIMVIQTGDAIYAHVPGSTEGIDLTGIHSTAPKLPGSPQLQPGSGFLPQPSQYFATMIVFFFLAGLAMAGDKAAKLAGAFGGVAAIAIALRPNASGKPLVVGFLGWLAAMMKAPPGGQHTTAATVTSFSAPYGATTVQAAPATSGGTPTGTNTTGTGLMAQPPTLYT